MTSNTPNMELICTADGSYLREKRPRAAADIEQLARIFFVAAQRRSVELDKDGISQTAWDDDSPEAEMGRDVFRAGIAAVVAEIEKTGAR